MRAPLALATLLLGGCQQFSLNSVDKEPSLDIIRPTDGSTFDPAAPVTLCLLVADDGGVDDVTLVVDSSLDGTLVGETAEWDACDGGNAAFDLTLSAGVHVITVTARDEAAHVVTATTTIAATDDSPPNCAFVSPLPGDRFPVGTTVDLAATVTDAETPAQQLAVSLTSDVDGELWTGNADSSGDVVFSTSALSIGDHYLNLEVTDAREQTDLCALSLTIDPCEDTDNDGFTTCEGDCDDTDANANPSGTETPNGRDDDCDGTTDEGTVLYDDDGDGFNELDGDCDDSDASIAPDASEIVDDGIDQDCSGEDSITCAADADGDTYGSPTNTVVSTDEDCSDSGEADDTDDCDDTAATIHPGAEESPGNGIDENCDGNDAATCYVDADDDGFGSEATFQAVDGDCDDPGESAKGGDCNDGAASVNPNGTEVPDDGIDQDCSGSDTVTCQVDADRDGIGGTNTVLADDGNCTDDGEARTDDDCDDSNANIKPGAPEVADDGIDQDCSGSDTVTCYVDADEDGVGGVATLLADDGDCTDTGESTESDDCDPNDPTIYPGATEVPDDGIDQDCSGSDGTACFLDSDGDGFGGPSPIVSSDDDCDDPGESSNNDDCDDTDASINPDATEIPDDGIDQNCQDDYLAECFRDADGDGYGSTTVIGSVDADCIDDGESLYDTDCDDTDPDFSPDAVDMYGNNIDENCDGMDGVDADGDGHASEDSGGDDCNDAVDTAHPGASELRDGWDNDCDFECDEGLINEGDLVITEVMIDPQAVTDQWAEWFEVYNTTNIDIRMCLGWKIFDQGQDQYLFAAGTEVLVPAGGYKVLGKNANPNINGGVQNMFAYGNDVLMSNSSDEIGLSFRGLVDLVVYTGTWPGSYGKSMQLDPANTSASLNDTRESWCTATKPYGKGDLGTPGFANTDCGN